MRWRERWWEGGGEGGGGSGGRGCGAGGNRRRRGEREMPQVHVVAHYGTVVCNCTTMSGKNQKIYSHYCTTTVP